MFPYISDMENIWRTPFDQHETFIEPLVTWLRARGVNFQNGVFVRDVAFTASLGRITVNRLDNERDGVKTSIPVTPDDLVLLTSGSQATDMSGGSMTEAPRPQRAGRSWALWKRLAQERPDFGNPDAFFGESHVSDSHWVTFTVTTTGMEYLDLMSALTGSETGRSGLVSLIESGWLLSLSVFHQPEIIGQPPGTYVWWGYGLFPERNGNFVRKRMDECTGAEILEEVLRQLRFDRQLDAIMTSSICVPCDMPYANNIWMPRTLTDRPRLFRRGRPISDSSASTWRFRGMWHSPSNIPPARRGKRFTSCSSAAPPPPVYQAQRDLKALLAALKVFVFPKTARP